MNEPHPPEPPLFKKILGTTALGLAFVIGAKRQRDADIPVIANCGPKISKLQHLAFSLADEGRHDDEAVEELRALAGGRRNLLDAAASCRIGGAARDHRRDNRANALLVAAARGGSVELVTPEQEAWFDEVEAFVRLSPEDRYARLVELQPDIAEIDRKLREARQASPRGQLSELDVGRFIAREVNPLVGLTARDAQGLLETDVAFNLRFAHRSTQSGLPQFTGWSGPWRTEYEPAPRDRWNRNRPAFDQPFERSSQPARFHLSPSPALPMGLNTGLGLLSDPWGPRASSNAQLACAGDAARTLFPMRRRVARNRTIRGRHVPRPLQ